jgi:MFS family permease
MANNETVTSNLVGRYRGLPRNVFALSLVSLFNDVSSEIIYPLLPLFLTLTLGASPAVVGIIEGISESVAGILKLFAGYFSDRLGKRKFLVVIGYVLTSFTRPLLAFTNNWYQVLAIRLSDRVGKGLRGVPRDAMIADSVTPETRGLAFGLNRGMDHAGAVVGPLIGSLSLWLVAENLVKPTANDYRQIFILASIPAILAVFVVIFFVREAKRETHERHASKVKLSLAGFDSNFKRFLFIVALFTLSNSSDAFLLLRAQESGITVTSIPLLWALLHVVKVVTSFIGGDLSDRLGRKALIVSGWMIYAFVYAGFAFVSSAWMAWALFLIYGIYFGLAEGTEKALVADLVKPEQRGTAYGLYNLAFSITVLPASLLLGGLWQLYGVKAAFLTGAFLGLSAVLLLIVVVKTNPQNVNSDA